MVNPGPGVRGQKPKVREKTDVFTLYEFWLQGALWRKGVGRPQGPKRQSRGQSASLRVGRRGIKRRQSSILLGLSQLVKGLSPALELPYSEGSQI